MRDSLPRRILLAGAAHRDALLRRTLLWGISVLCTLMLVVVANGAAARSQAEAQVAAARAHNAALAQTIAQTSQAIATAKSDDEIEREARRWGYLRPGDAPVIIVSSSSK